MTHINQNLLQAQLECTASSIEIGTIYYHYKNPELFYKIVGIGIQEATDEPCIIYQSLYGAQITWVRNLDSWLSKVEHGGKIVPRFQKKAAS